MNLDNKDFELIRLQKEFRQLYGRTENKRSDFIVGENFARSGGFFRTKKRKQMLGLMGKSGGRTGENTMVHFWQEARELVETALIDLNLFIRTADDKDVYRVVNKETFQPIVEALLFPNSIQEIPKPDPERAKIALVLIIKSLEYLRTSTARFTTSSQERMIKDAVDISKQLTALLLPDNERMTVLMEGQGI